MRHTTSWIPATCCHRNAIKSTAVHNIDLKHTSHLRKQQTIRQLRRELGEKEMRWDETCLTSHFWDSHFSVIRFSYADKSSR